MKITKFLDIRSIEANLGASNKPGVLRELVGLILRVEPQLDPNVLVETLDRREKLQSTGIGNGVAIPHGRTDCIDRIIACVGRSTHGVDFQSLDGQPTQLFFTLFVPEAAQGAHLKALARLSRLLKNDETRQKLLDASDAEAMYRIIEEEDSQL